VNYKTFSFELIRLYYIVREVSLFWPTRYVSGSQCWGCAFAAVENTLNSCLTEMLLFIALNFIFRCVYIFLNTFRATFYSRFKGRRL